MSNMNNNNKLKQNNNYMNGDAEHNDADITNESATTTTQKYVNSLLKMQMKPDFNDKGNDKLKNKQKQVQTRPNQFRWTPAQTIYNFLRMCWFYVF